MTATARKTILVVDDEAGIRRVLKICLSAAGYVVHEAASGREAIGVISVLNPDVIVLDLGLPDIGGAQVVAQVRQTSQCPILIVSVRGQESDKVSALDAGADDYLTKPFGNQELLARVRALLRRSGARELTRKLQCGSLTIDAAQHRIELDGKAVRAPTPRSDPLSGEKASGPLEMRSRSQGWNRDSIVASLEGGARLMAIELRLRFLLGRQAVATRKIAMRQNYDVRPGTTRAAPAVLIADTTTEALGRAGLAC